MSCPRCGQADVTGDSCPRCGVIFAKLRASAQRPSEPDAASEPSPPDRALRPGVPWGLVIAGLVLLAGVVVGLQIIRPRASLTPPPVARAGVAAPSGEGAALPSPPAPVDLMPSALPAEVELSGGLTAEDRQRAAELTARVNGRQPLLSQDVQTAETLLSRHPEEHALRELLQAVLLSTASQERQRGNLAAAARALERATAVPPATVALWLALFQVKLEAGDWAGAETAARGALALEPRNAEALTGLGWALFRQDRNREAAEALQASLEVRADPTSRALLDRIRKGMSDEAGMTEQQLAHFHVRYDGAEHQDVGREILRALERHYATLVTTLDHQPSATIPVILFTSQAYYDASGAPSWSGGVYDGLDGRIRIPIGGITASLTPEMDGTLIHELTHAFIADRTRGVAPREIHEGFAQYMEGKRIETMLDADELKALATGRITGVGGYYLSALSFVEYLIALRGVGGMNDLLRQMGESGSADEGFRRVHGQGFKATMLAWQQRLRQQHGG
jgi:tetratricopeptide (TPR) repeat protein